MMTFLFTIGIIYLCVKVGIFAFQAAWGITKFLFFVVALPLIIVGLFVAGIVYLAFPLLIIGIILSIVRPHMV